MMTSNSLSFSVESECCDLLSQCLDRKTSSLIFNFPRSFLVLLSLFKYFSRRRLIRLAVRSILVVFSQTRPFKVLCRATAFRN